MSNKDEKPKTEQRRMRGVRLYDHEWEKLQRLGGVDWLRKQIERAKEPQS